jgi:hypothetical protein
MAPLLLNERLLYQYKSSNENFQQNQFLYKLGNKIVETTLGPFLWSVNCIDIIYFWKKVERASSHIPISKLFVLHFKFIYRMVILNFYDVYLFNFLLFNNVFYFILLLKCFLISFGNIWTPTIYHDGYRSTWMHFCLDFQRYFCCKKSISFIKIRFRKVTLFSVSCWIRK